MRYGSMCSGVGGLDLAVEQVFGATPAWFCESDPHAARVLARHWPGVPVLPDIKTTKWEEFVVPALRNNDLADEPKEVVPPNSLAVDIVCAGYPLERASPSRWLGGEPEPLTPATCGRTSSQPFAYYDPASSSLKTCQGTFDLGLTSSSVILPKRGSMRSGFLFEQATLEPATDESAYSCLPTPSANQYECDQATWEARRERIRAQGINGNGFGLTTAMAVQTLMPTPTVGDSKAARNSTATRHRTPPTGVHDGNTLTDAVTLLPTPRTSDSTGGGVMATEVVISAPLLPTPTAWLGRRPSSSIGDPARWNSPRNQELSDFIAWLGVLMSPPSDDGSTSSADPPQPPPMRKDG